MATVYRALDPRHGRSVAVKVLNSEVAAALGTERFLQEIKTAASLTHPHIVPVHDSGETGGVLFYVMPHIVGETLRERITRDQRIPAAETVRLRGADRPVGNVSRNARFPYLQVVLPIDRDRPAERRDRIPGMED